jgi:hypothetical protein
MFKSRSECHDEAPPPRLNVPPIQTQVASKPKSKSPLQHLTSIFSKSPKNESKSPQPKMTAQKRQNLAPPKTNFLRDSNNDDLARKHERER